MSTYLFSIPYDPNGWVVEEGSISLFDFIGRAVFLGFEVKGQASAFDSFTQEVSVTGPDVKVREFARVYDPEMTDEALDELKI